MKAKSSKIPEEFFSKLLDLCIEYDVRIIDPAGSYDPKVKFGRSRDKSYTFGISGTEYEGQNGKHYYELDTISFREIHRKKEKTIKFNEKKR